MKTTLQSVHHISQNLSWKKVTLGLIHGGLVLIILGVFLSLLLSDEYVLALEVGGSEELAYLSNAWDLVVYQIFDGVEVARSPLERTTSSLLIPRQALNGHGTLEDRSSQHPEVSPTIPIFFEIPIQYRNSQRIDPQTIEQRPQEVEAIRNTPGVILENVRIGIEDSSLELRADIPLVLHGLDTRPRDLAFSQELGALGLLLEPREIILPFTLTLDSFEAVRFPGTSEIAQYQIQISLDPPGVSGFLSANTSFRFGNYSFTYTSYRFSAPEQGIHQPITLLTIVYTPWDWILFLGSGILMVGLIMFLFQKLPIDRRSIQSGSGVLAFVLAMSWLTIGSFPLSAQVLDHNQPSSSGSDQPFSFSRQVVDRIGKLVVQDRGRFMPLEAFAFKVLDSLVITERIDGLSPLEIMTLILLAPGQADTVGLFHINNPEVFQVLELPYIQSGRYSYNQLAQGFFLLSTLSDVLDQILIDTNRPFDSLEQELLQLYQRGVLYLQLRGGLNPTALGAPGLDPFRWEDHPLRLIPKTNRLEPTIIPKALHPLESELVLDTPLWQTLGDRDVLLELVAIMVQGVDPLDTTQWLDYSKSLLSLQEQYFVSAFGDQGARRIFFQRDAELFMLRISPWVWVQVVLVFSFLLWLIYFQFQKLLEVDSRIQQRIGILAKISLTVLSFLGMLGGIIGILLTASIVGRPPVIHLSSSLLLASTVVMVVWALGSIRNFGVDGPNSPLFVFYGFIAWLLVVGGLYLELGEDVFRIVPVGIDTNPILILQNIFIILGYCGVILGGASGGVLLNLPQDLNQNSQFQVNLERILTFGLHIGLVVISLGVLLGVFSSPGWARFWTWELRIRNSLFVILWLVFLTHLRSVGIKNPRITQSGAAFGLLIMGFSWFGTNLMGQELQGFGTGQDAMVPFRITLGIVGGMFLSSGIFSLGRRMKGSKNL